MDENRIEGGVKKVAGKAKEAAGAVTGDHVTEAAGTLRAVAGDAQRAYGQAVDTVREVADKTSDVVRETAGKAASTARDVAEQTSDTVREGTGRAAEMVRDATAVYPVQSLLIAGAIGFACGMLFRRN